MKYYMTKREIVMKKYPDKCSNEYCGGVLGCPSDYGFSDSCNIISKFQNSCDVCWSQVLDADVEPFYINNESVE